MKNEPDHFLVRNRSKQIAAGESYGMGKFYNEIIIAYRKHASPLFPLFTRWVDDTGMKGFQVTKFSEEGMADDIGKIISVDGVACGW